MTTSPTAATSADSRVRALVIVLLVGAAIALVILHPPRLASVVADLAGVSWSWMSVALLANVASIGLRVEAWRTLLARPGAGPAPGRIACLSAYSVGLLGNTLLPARAGDAARVLVATRHMAPDPQRLTAVAGSVLAQRCLDVGAFALLVVAVLATGQAPTWVTAGTLSVLGAAALAIALAVWASRRSGGRAQRLARPLQWALAVTRDGVAALREPRVALRAGALQIGGWIAQLMVVDLTLRAFSTPVPLVASALVLVLLNGILAFPLWPGGVGAYQAVVALALAPYGVASATGLSLGLGIQAVESLVGVAFGLAFVAHEGLSLAALRRGRGRGPMS